MAPTEKDPLLRKPDGEAKSAFTARNIAVGILAACLLVGIVAVFANPEMRASVGRYTGVLGGHGTTPEQDAAADAKTKAYEPKAGDPEPTGWDWVMKILFGNGPDDSKDKYESGSDSGTSTQGADVYDTPGTGRNDGATGRNGR